MGIHEMAKPEGETRRAKRVEVFGERMFASPPARRSEGAV